MLRFNRHVLVAVAALVALCACPATDYWEGDGPDLDDVSPEWENGNLGGEHVIGLVFDITDLSSEEEDIVEPYVVTVNGSFGAEATLEDGTSGTCYERCAPDQEGDDCEAQFPAVQFGSRTATILDARNDAIQVLAPPGPVRGGKVDVSVTCWYGKTVMETVYDFVLGDVTDADHYNDFGELVNEDNEPIRRMGPIFENEYASFTLFYTAAPYSNVPEPAGYGFFFNQPAPRASLFYGGNPGMVYAGEDADELASMQIPAQIPEINYEAPEQGDRIKGGEEIFFFRNRDTSNQDEVLTSYARKVPTTNQFAPDPYVPEQHSLQLQNNEGVWLGIPFDDDEGLERIRYMRVHNDIGRYCSPLNPANPPGEDCPAPMDGDCEDSIEDDTPYEDAVADGCPQLTDEQLDEAEAAWTDDDQEMPYAWAHDKISDGLNDTRIPVDFRWKWLEPDTPSREELTDLFPHAAPERVGYLDCVLDVDADGDGYTANGGDCNDRDKFTYPGREETCTGSDSDCDGVVDDGTACFDDDADGFTEDDGDCNDTDPTVYPGATEVADDGIDSDCNGTIDDGFVDADGDGFAADDCDDNDDDAYPGAEEEANGADDDCDGEIDENTSAYDDDGDGVTEDDGDCNDGDAAQSPGAVEVSGDGIDNDCDDIVDEGRTEEDCEAESGIGLSSGVYEDAFLCRSFDEDDDFPWWTEAVAPEAPYCCYCIVLESLPSVEVVQGKRYVDVPQLAQGSWALDDDNLYYDGIADGLANAVGENVLARGQQAFIAYDEGYYRGDLVPSKNIDMVVPDPVPPPMGYTCRDGGGDTYEVDREDGCDSGDVIVSSYDDTPYITVPPVVFETFYWAFGSFRNAPEDNRVFFGFPALLPMPGEEAIDWRIALPGGADEDAGDPMDLGGWDDTYFILSLDVLDIERPGGLDSSSVWMSKAFAWAGDDYITFPAETLATLPAVGSVGALDYDSEVQQGQNLLGVARLQVHRTANWVIGEDFRDANGRAIFDVNTEWQYYFTNQHSCYDGIDNDGDGLCDIEGCRNENDEFLPPDPACACEESSDPEERYDCPELESAPCQDGDDNDEDGLVDEDDPDCWNDGQYDPNDTNEEPSCNDGEDNDSDGWIDYPADPGCAEIDSSDARGFDYDNDSTDGTDDDGDHRIDALDPGCTGARDSEDNDTCTDGIDNNGDGWIDFDDLTCAPDAYYAEGEAEYTPVASLAYECSSFERTLDPEGNVVDVPLDEDGDGVANIDDHDCQWGWDPSGEGGAPDECSDRIDNDGDGWIDGDDYQCLIDPTSESTGPLSDGECDDGLDNDSDGWIDELDPDCLTAADDESFYMPEGLECNDLEDNDGDGLIDSEDPGCPTGKDNHEED